MLLLAYTSWQKVEEKVAINLKELLVSPLLVFVS